MNVTRAYSWSADQADYEMGYLSGRRGEPDPMGNANYARWLGWRDGAASAGFLPRCGPFARIIDQWGYS